MRAQMGDAPVDGATRSASWRSAPSLPRVRTSKMRSSESRPSVMITDPAATTETSCADSDEAEISAAASGCRTSQSRTAPSRCADAKASSPRRARACTADGVRHCVLAAPARETSQSLTTRSVAPVSARLASPQRRIEQILAVVPWADETSQRQRPERASQMRNPRSAQAPATTPAATSIARTADAFFAAQTMAGRPLVDHVRAVPSDDAVATKAASSAKATS
mmetsp:Transcript_28192/g.97085  ORF Transcript_28192/g.97085 Transcript_28192/m.97085 type:complete len:223 (-) Transcript_28192:394-1062(-)